MAKTIILYITNSDRQSDYLLSELRKYAEKNCKAYFIDKRYYTARLDNVEIYLFPINYQALCHIDRFTQYIIIDKDITSYRYWKEKLRDMKMRIMKEPKEISEKEMFDLLDRECG